MRKIIASSVSALFLFVNTPTVASDPYEAIIAAQQDGRYLQALQQADKILVSNKDDVQALLIKGNVHRLMGNEAEASYIFKQIIKQHPNMPEAYNNLAVMYAQSGKMALAIETLQQAFATSASYSTAYKNLRTLYSEMASSAYRDALNIEKPKAKENQINLTSLNQVESMPVVAVANEPVLALANTFSNNPAQQVAQSDEAAQSQTQASAAVAASQAAKQVAKDVDSKADTQTQVSEMVAAWSNAWSGQKTTDYLGFYHPEFQPTNQMSLSAWKTYRSKRIVRPKFINLEIVGLMVERRGDGEASAIFEQHYRSDTYADTVVKKLTLAKHQGKWKIMQEVAL